MKILHTEWSDGLGGQEKRVLMEAAGLSRRGHETALVCREGARIRGEAEGLGIAVHTVPMRKPYDLDSMIRLRGFLRKNRFDVVNTHSGVDSWIGGIAAKLAGVPVLVRTRHLNIALKRNPLNFIHYLPDMYIACGDNMRQNLVESCGFPAHKVVSIATGVAPEFFEVRRSREARAKYGLDRGAPVIANVGILRSVKGHEVTLRSVQRVVDAVPGVRYLIAGDGPRQKALEDLARELGIVEHVLFTGFVEDVREVYALSDVVVLSSWSEGLPQSVLQAMAAGVPVVATRVGGVPEVVVHGDTGLLVEPGDHEGLAQGIITLLRQPEAGKRLAGRARELVMKEHSAEHMLDQIEQLYERLLKNKKEC
ncbi:MAG: glycosyltransferase family 4 protein [Nitrospiraceae bacterium]|nr:MAG: glycosyltransferase family 4 protein [Nitrospiraceae bacterium]